MELMTISKQDFADLVNTLAQGPDEVIGVVKKGQHFAFDAIDDASEMSLDYDITILPPKKYFLPVKSAMLTFKTGDAGSYEVVEDATKRVIIGVHPEDLAAIALLDKAHSEGQSDGFYLSRRANAVLVGLNPTQVNKYRFTDSMVTTEADGVADVMLTDLGDSYAVEVVSEKGKELMAGSKAAAADVADKVAGAKAKVKDELAMPVAVKDLPALLEGKEKHETFAKRADKCFSCGSCVLVCPTCYCFDVNDEVELDLQSGRRVRSWDGCTIENFATVAGDHNFREKSADRLRHRIFRKGKYLMERFNMAGCVGCGRCSKACVPDIANPVDIINDLK